jgi:hypothetical protein
MSTMVLHDARLKGGTPVHYDHRVLCNDTHDIDAIVYTVAKRGKPSPLWPLHILCHGYAEQWFHCEDNCLGTKPVSHGGFGLQLGKQGLYLHNVDKTKAWNRRVELIVLFACSPAEDSGKAMYGGVWGDGVEFCRKLFLNTGATVIAARNVQYYHNTSGKPPIDFDDWEGPVYAFDGEDPSGRRLNNPDVYSILGKKKS